MRKSFCDITTNYNKNNLFLYVFHKDFKFQIYQLIILFLKSHKINILILITIKIPAFLYQFAHVYWENRVDQR